MTLGKRKETLFTNIVVYSIVSIIYAILVVILLGVLKAITEFIF